jgi:hypothetical protein
VQAHDDNEAELGAVSEWFAERGFCVSFSEADGYVWADLTRIPSGGSVAQYGRGDTRVAAAVRAKHRYQVEQEGVPAGSDHS